MRKRVKDLKINDMLYGTVCIIGETKTQRITIDCKINTIQKTNNGNIFIETNSRIHTCCNGVENETYLCDEAHNIFFFTTEKERKNFIAASETDI